MQPRPEERTAADLVSRSLGVPVEWHDTGDRPSAYDFSIVWADRRPSPLEVTQMTVEHRERVQAEMRKRGTIVPCQELRSTWTVVLDDRMTSFPYRKLLERLPLALAIVERRGLEYFFTDLLEGDSFPNDIRTLPIAYGFSFPPVEDDGPVIVIGYPSEAYKVGSEVLQAFLEERMASDDLADVRRKLAASGASDRHLFVWLAPYNLGAFAPLFDAARPPDEGPRLPHEITTLWVASRPMESRLALWRATRAGGWEVIQAR